ncbi:MAG: hypothetical protein FJZ08_04120, partial [Candidatus Omnitrophica bacterium]|nr:hypothetical protein [Candidatus Omnitrophota bacterium]
MYNIIVNMPKKPKYYLNEKGEFIIENYTFSKPFANFFPGIAGKYGIPMWVFYVNRGQGIISAGTRDKDHAILEFFPANKAWQLASLRGFRTFIKLKNSGKSVFYEPFHNGFTSLEFKLSNKMRITSYDLKLEELNSTLGISTEVEYFTIPNDSYAALARVLTIKNIGKKSINLELLDGVPQVVPFGTANLFLKKLCRTIEAWMNVRNLEKGAPFYKLDVDPTDRPEVIHIKEGNFYLPFYYQKNTPKILKAIIDPSTIFDPVSDFTCPYQFLKAGKFSYPKEQINQSKTPCAFALLNKKLAKGEEITIYSLLGYMRDLKTLNDSVPRITKKAYLEQKRQENRQIIEELQQDIDTKSSSPGFNLYAKQTYLDNILRGGYPVLFKTESNKSVFYLYSRKHGDLERDYNKFHLQATYFSQGNGNYRDINQNRRSENWFTPEINDDNLIYFFNLIQSDGFNPLVVKGLSFKIKDAKETEKALSPLIPGGNIQGLISYLSKPFSPGDVIFFLEEHKLKLNCSYDKFLEILLSHSLKIQEAEHGEGFWSDHWAYNLDLLESYLGIYPENLKSVLFEKRVFTFYDNTEVVKPRQEKYLLHEGKAKQLHSIGVDNAKRELIKKRGEQPHIVRTDYGKGPIYQTTLINKLICLLVNKLSSLDPSGVGIEMEANKPNWYDALNGLPGLFGSSLCETLELKRLVLFIRASLWAMGVEKVSVSEETLEFLLSLDSLLKEASQDCFLFWDKSYSLKEDYRYKTRLGFSGKEKELAISQLIPILNNSLKKIDAGIEKAKDPKKELYYSYFVNEVTEYDLLKDHYIIPKGFIQKRLPLFLEGQMHSLRLAEGPQEAKKIYQATKASNLFDKKLKMYKVTDCLKSMPKEIGRCRVFSPGWLEHESIWLHMEYKYLLETLKKGLYEEFFEDFKNVLIPFQDPQRYGRSILENSSFIVSSAFVDKNLHGNGYVARLSGSTAEFIQLWLIM